MEFLMILIKLFLEAKKTTGNDMNADTRNPKLSRKYNVPFIYPCLNDIKKFPSIFLPNRQYPIIPTTR